MEFNGTHTRKYYKTDMGERMIGIPLFLKFIIAIIWDFLDFTIGRIPGFGTLWDFAGIVLAFLLWGAPGLIAFWEVFDPTDQLDAEIPTITLIGLIMVLTGRYKT